MTYQRKNRGVCSLSTTVTLSEDGTIENVEVLGGCNGNAPHFLYGKCGAFLMRAAGRKRLCACPLAAAAILAQGKGRRRCYTDSKGLIRPRAGC